MKTENRKIKRKEAEKKGKPLTWPQPIWPKSKPAQHPTPQSSPTYPFGRLQPQVGKHLGGAPADTRFAAASWTLEMKAATLRRL
jgi:hypothetical protein